MIGRPGGSVRESSASDAATALVSKLMEKAGANVSTSSSGVMAAARHVLSFYFASCGDS